MAGRTLEEEEVIQTEEGMPKQRRFPPELRPDKHDCRNQDGIPAQPIDRLDTGIRLRARKSLRGLSQAAARLLISKPPIARRRARCPRPPTIRGTCIDSDPYPRTAY